MHSCSPLWLSHSLLWLSWKDIFEEHIFTQMTHFSLHRQPDVLPTSEQEKCLFEVFQRLCFYLEFFPLSLSLMFNWLGSPRRGFRKGLFSFPGAWKEWDQRRSAPRQPSIFCPNDSKYFLEKLLSPEAKRRWCWIWPGRASIKWAECFFFPEGWGEETGNEGLESTPIVCLNISYPSLKWAKKRKRYSHSCLAVLALHWDLAKTNTSNRNSWGHYKKALAPEM